MSDRDNYTHPVAGAGSPHHFSNCSPNIGEYLRTMQKGYVEKQLNSSVN